MSRSPRPASRSSPSITVLRLAEDVGLSADRLDRHPRELSGGQRQRVGLARRLSYPLVTHDLTVIDFVADHVAVMHLGRIVESGDPDVLFRSPAHHDVRALIDAVPEPSARPVGTQVAAIRGERHLAACQLPLVAPSQPATDTGATG